MGLYQVRILPYIVREVSDLQVSKMRSNGTDRKRGRVMTNADCIRHMSDEQLYEFLSEWECGDIDYSVTFCDLCNEATKRGEIGNVLNLDCDGCRKHWLQRDAVDYGGLMYWKKNTTFDTNADRKTEPQTETSTNSEKVQLKVQLTDEPQTEREGE